MAIQLTPEQEQRIQAVVDGGAYPSTHEARAAAGFEGEQEELEGFLMEGLASKELSEEDFWDSIDRETNSMLAAHHSAPHA